MDVNTILLVVFAVFVVLLAAETPIAFSLAAAGSLGIYLLDGTDRLMPTLGSLPFTSIASYSLAIVPMYILLGMLALRSNIAERAFWIANRLTRRLKGGLGVATIMACAGFGAVTGSSVATAATIGKLAVREMHKYGYPLPLASGIVAAAGTLGALIPPSVLLVFYGIFSGESVAALLVAALVPAGVSVAAYIAYCIIRAPHATLVPADSELSKALATLGDGSREVSEVSSTAEVAETPDTESDRLGGRGQYFRAALWIAIIFALVMSGIYTGVFTVIESGAMGAMFALFVLIVETWGLGWKELAARLYRALVDTAGLTSMALTIVVGAGVMSVFLTMSGTPARFTGWILSLDVSPTLVVILLLAALIPLGMALEGYTIIIIAVPLIHPVVEALGFDGIWFAILFAKMIEVGLVTPPVGMNVFVVAGAAEIPVEQAFRGIAPLVLVDLAVISVLFAFPSLTLWLPTRLGVL